MLNNFIYLTDIFFIFLTYISQLKAYFEHPEINKIKIKLYIPMANFL